MLWPWRGHFRDRKIFQLNLLRALKYHLRRHIRVRRVFLRVSVRVRRVRRARKRGRGCAVRNAIPVDLAVKSVEGHFLKNDGYSLDGDEYGECS